jgi:NAD(P)-dependent dehydrogenase (short-subunit alcohol dehydrogenase family)
MRRVIIITGASRGIGAATALLAAERGYCVVLNHRDSMDAAEQIAARIQSAGGTALALQADVTVESQVVGMFETVRTVLGQPTALVNNAGVLDQQMSLSTMSAERITRVLLTNVLGSMLCAREAVKHMSTRNGFQGGAIVNVSSRAAQLGSPNEYVDYAASKAAVDALTVGLSKEVAGEGIRVNAVRPGLIHTSMHASGGEPGRVQRMQQFIPLQRGGQPEEVARAVLWLLSDEASYVTGALLDVSGGR